MGQTNLYMHHLWTFWGFFPLIEYWTEPCGHVPLLGTRPCPHVDIWIKQGSNITNVGHYLRSDQYQHVDNICKRENKEEIKRKCFFYVFQRRETREGNRSFAWLEEENHRLHGNCCIVEVCLSELSKTWVLFQHNSKSSTWSKNIFIIVSLLAGRWLSM